MRRHRYSQRRAGGASGTGTLFLAILLILAVATGYTGTKYVIAPYLLEGKLWSGFSDAPPDPVSTGSGIISGQQDIKDGEELSSGAAVVIPSGPALTTDMPVIPPPGPVPAQPSPALTGKFAVQFGSFSSQGAADKAVSDLAAKNIKASVLQRDGAFKVVGTSYDTKELAREEAERLRATVEDVYVVGI